MTKHNRNIYSILFIILVIIMQSCRYRIGNHYSCCIKQSRKIGVYLCSYYPNNIKINDSIAFKIKGVFAEKKYKQLNNNKIFPKYLVDSSKIQLVINFEPSWNDLWEKYGYSETWKFSNMYSVRKNIWAIDINSPFPPDTVKVNVINYETDSTGGAGIHYGEIIGDFIIVKKKIENN